MAGGADGSDEQPHIVMLPFMAQGHIIPFLALAKLIVSRCPSVSITIVTTPINARNLQSSTSSNIHVHALPFRSSDHGLPPDVENTDSLSYPLILSFYPASESLRPHVSSFLSSLSPSPSILIADVFFSWTVPLARRLSIPHAVFTTCGAYGTLGYFSLYLHQPHIRSAHDDFHVPGFPASYRLHRSQMAAYFAAADGTEPWFGFFRRQIELCKTSDYMLCKTVEALEPEGLRLLSDFLGLPVWPVGPLMDRTVGKEPGIEVAACMDWLSTHPPKSVVYVSFGSQNSISVAAMAALGRGLEASGSPFVWVVRPPLGFDVKGSFRDEWLPDGFEERVAGRGMVVRGWAPQVEILGHRSTGAFLSHCGWNSVLESLSRGVPVMGWPLSSDQFCNMKMMEEELGVGVEVGRGVEGVGVDVEGVVREVMGGGETGRRMRERAEEVAEVIGAAVREDGSAVKALDGFIETAVASRRTKKEEEEEV